MVVGIYIEKTNDHDRGSPTKKIFISKTNLASMNKLTYHPIEKDKCFDTKTEFEDHCMLYLHGKKVRQRGYLRRESSEILEP